MKAKRRKFGIKNKQDCSSYFVFRRNGCSNPLWEIANEQADGAVPARTELMQYVTAELSKKYIMMHGIQLFFILYILQYVFYNGYIVALHFVVPAHSLSLQCNGKLCDLLQSHMCANEALDMSLTLEETLQKNDENCDAYHCHCCPPPPPPPPLSFSASPPPSPPLSAVSPACCL